MVSQAGDQEPNHEDEHRRRKTLVGLLLLQSSLNEGIRPAIYITPNKFLTSQVLSEARDLGIAATDSEDDPLFLRGEAILVANIFKVVNGGSRFGVGQTKIPLGAIVVDDAHACFSVIEDQFTVQIEREHEAYGEIWALFSEAIKEHDQFRHHDIVSFDPAALLEIPFWMWQQQVASVREILKRHSATDDNIKFTLRLIEHVLPLCQCVFAGRRLAFAPRCTPIEIIPAFAQARRRIFMTATLANDGVLVTHLKADPASIGNPIAPSTSDMGSRLILTPQELNKEFTESDLKEIARQVAVKRNVVVLVPSAHRADFWRPMAQQVLDSTNMDAGIAALRQRHVGLSVLINRYDGIDLPGTACELLILDGLPRAIGPLRERRNNVLEGSAGLLVEQVQRVEQGMGRGVRSGDDRCVVVLFGSDLTKIVNFPDTFDRFTPSTQAQIRLARDVAQQIKSTSAQELIGVMSYSFDANPDWLRASKLAIVNANNSSQSYLAGYVPLEREAFDLASIGQYERAADKIKEAAEKSDDDFVRGYLKQQQAEYTNFWDRPLAQSILTSAVSANSAVVKPIAGIQHARIKAHNDQAVAASEFMNRFSTPDQMLIWSLALRDRLVFDPEKTDDFERAVKELGEALGFTSTRPDKETGKGPDNLWALSPGAFAVIECKSGATTSEISKADCNQLLGSNSWFATQYPGSTATPVMIHSSLIFSSQSFPADDFRLLDKAGLEALKSAFRAYCEAIATSQNWRDTAKLGVQLLANKLTGSLILPSFTKGARKA